MRQHVRWRTHMSQIRPYYAVRCNSSPAVIEVLAALGTGFICTNKVCFNNTLELRYTDPPSNRIFLYVHFLIVS